MVIERQEHPSDEESSKSDLVESDSIKTGTHRSGQENIRKQMEFHARLLAAVGESVIVTDPVGTIIFWGEGAHRIYGWREEEVIGKQLREVIGVQSTEKQTHQIMRSLAKGQAWSGEYLVKRKDGREFPVLVNTAPMKDESGKVNALIGISRDITHRKQMEEALSEREKKLRILSDFAYNWEYWIGADNTFLYMSHSCVNVTGYTENEFMDDPGLFLRIIHPDDCETIKAHIYEHISHPEAMEIEFRIRHRNGRERWISHVCRPVIDEKGKFQGRRASNQDITHRKQVEGKLREAEQDLNRAQAVAQTGSWRLDVRKNALLWSNENHRIFGIPEGTTMTYETFLSCVHPEDREYVDSKWQAALQGEEYNIEHRIIAEDEVKWVHQRAELEFDQQGMLKGGFGTTQDITDNKKAEEQMAFQSMLLDTIDDCILATDTNNRIIFWGKGSANLLGWQPDEILWRSSAGTLMPEESQSLIEAIDKSIWSGQGWAGEITVKHRDGALIPLLVRASPVQDKNGRLIAAVAVGKDISELKKIDRLKDEFIGLVSHELRTPLTIITGSLKTALSPEVSSEVAHEMILNAIDGAESLANILENMLELSRHQATRLNLKLEKVGICDVARRVIEQLKTQGARQQFRVDFPDGLSAVEADSVRLQRILYNLIENAIKYSPEDSEIRVACRKDGDFIITEISDQGQGIPPDQQKKLFELFGRLETSPPVKGIGLGLVVCKRLVEALGGWIKVDSEPEKGSMFTFALPAHKART
jgi:PAS domain S-box-containing protein